MKGTAQTAKPFLGTAVITNPYYRHALTAVQNENALLALQKCRSLFSKRDNAALDAAWYDRAFLMPLKSGLIEELPFKNGALETKDRLLTTKDYSPEQLPELDFPLLWAVYSVNLHQISKALAQIKGPNAVEKFLIEPKIMKPITLHVSEFCKILGKKSNDRVHIDAIVTKLKALSNLVGIHFVIDNEKAWQEQYVVIQNVKYVNETRSIQFIAPYLTYIAHVILYESLKKGKDGYLCVLDSGRVRTNASHSFALNMELASERNKAAVEILCYIAFLIERSGKNGTPNAAAEKIIKECPVLEYRLSDPKISPSVKNKKLKRAFSKAWALLESEKCSKLMAEYIDRQIFKEIPTVGNPEALAFKIFRKEGSGSQGS